jgi:NADPH:quinone reductase
MIFSISSRMQAIQQDEPNGSLILREIPVPHPGPGQVLVCMAAAPINPSDLGSLRGLSYGRQPEYPLTPGREGSGRVVAAGKGLLPRFLLGRRVACAVTTGSGTWSQYALTSARQCIPLYKNTSLEQGAMLLVNPLSALALMDIARRGKHAAMVNTAAASALGGMILRLGKRYQIPIIHIVRRQEQVDLLRQRGAEYVLNSNDQQFAEQLRETASKLRATLFIDAIGGSLTQMLAEAAPFGTTILLFSRMAEQDCPIDPFTALVKNLRFEGWFLGNHVRQKNLFQVLRLVQRAQSLLATDLHSPIHKRFPLADAQQAVEVYIQEMSAGKILLVSDHERVRIE